MEVETVNREGFLSAVEAAPVQIWNSDVAVNGYGDGVHLLARKDNGRLVGAWFCPLANSSGEVVRTARLLPYCSPWIAPDLHPVARQRLVYRFAMALRQRAATVELPLGPDFVDSQAFSHAGYTVLSRHTRVLSLRDGGFRDRYLPSVRNAIRAADRKTSITVQMGDQGTFEFSRALISQSIEVMKARTEFGYELSASAKVLRFSAHNDDGKTCGQVYVLIDSGWAYSMHSWFDRAGARGVPSLLLDRALAECGKRGVLSFDFEGSVVHSIDEFMAGFGAEPTNYGHIRWSQGESNAHQFG